MVGRMGAGLWAQRSWTVPVTCAAFLILLTPLSEAKTDADTGRIRTLLIGAQWHGLNVYVTSLLRSDPRLDVRGSVETSNGLLPEEVRRRARLDFPRTRQRLIGTIDALEINFAPPWALGIEQQQWVHDGIENEGLGLVLIHMGWQECLSEPLLRCNRPEDWMNSVIYMAWPMDVVLGEVIRPSQFMEIVQDSAVVSLPGFEKQPFGPAGPSTFIGLVHARPGATVQSRWHVGGEDAIISRRYGRGITLSIPVSGATLGDDVVRRWKYFLDFVLNKIYFSANVQIPQDPELTHSLRAAFQQFYEQRSLLINLIDFVDRFGANTRPLHDIIDGLEGKAALANKLYVAGDYQSSLDQIKKAMEGFVELSEESRKVRKRALLWVYLTEWLVVSGTSMLCGWLLWTIMVRRRYYKEVETTRLGNTK